jgi:hypothetical protein
VDEVHVGLRPEPQARGRRRRSAFSGGAPTPKRTRLERRDTRLDLGDLGRADHDRQGGHEPRENRRGRPELHFDRKRRETFSADRSQRRPRRNSPNPRQPSRKSAQLETRARRAHARGRAGHDAIPRAACGERPRSMGASCLTACTSCQRHVRCGERVCPFCGADVTTHYRPLEYRLKNRMSRGRAFSLGAALAAAGFAMSCDDETGAPPYGIAAIAGTSSGTSGVGGASPSAGGVAAAGSSSNGGALVTPGGGEPGVGGEPGASGGVGGKSSGGAAGADSGGADSGGPGVGGANR